MVLSGQRRGQQHGCLDLALHPRRGWRKRPMFSADPGLNGETGLGQAGGRSTGQKVLRAESMAAPASMGTGGLAARPPSPYPSRAEVGRAQGAAGGTHGQASAILLAPLAAQAHRPQPVRQVLPLGRATPGPGELGAAPEGNRCPSPHPCDVRPRGPVGLQGARVLPCRPLWRSRYSGTRRLGTRAPCPFVDAK